MNRQACIVGWSHVPFGKRDEPDVERLIAAVVPTAIRHAGVAASELDAVFVGVMNQGFSRQGFEGALAGTAVPELESVPFMRVENACATGSAAITAAADFIESGRGRLALVIGAEKMTACSAADAGEILLGASYRREEQSFQSFAGIFGHIAQLYFERYGDRSRELAMIAAKNHRNGVQNPLAQIRKDLGVDFCHQVSEKNPLVAGPLRRTDCSLISDGAAAIVLAEKSLALSLSRAIRFRARVHTSDALPLSRKDPLAFAGAARAWQAAFRESGLTLQDLDLVETHDCFTIAELIQYEAMGLAAPGNGHRVVLDGKTTREGWLPVNLSGGLKSKGHPIGATGVSMHIMACLQLMQEAGEMQLPNANLAGVFNMGGTSVANYVSILERLR